MKKFPSTDPDYNLWSLLFQTRRAMFKARVRELAPYNISPRQSGVLHIIQDLGGNATLTDIAWWLLLEDHSVSETISRMQRDGLVRKVKEGKSRIRVELTEKGLEVYHQASKRLVYHRILSSLSKAERQQLSLCLQKLLDKALEEARPDRKILFTPTE